MKDVARQDDILLLPRSIVDVRAYNNKKTYFIISRTRKQSKVLDEPTSKSLKALNSGLRSSIIKDDDGTYFRQKGVALDVKLKDKDDNTYRGFSSYGFNEIKYSYDFFNKNLPFSVMKPSHMERFNMEVDRSISAIENLLSKKFIPSYEYVYIDYSKKVIQDASSYIYSASAFKIKGDTRLDELIYFMTLKKYSNVISRKRDDFLSRICYNSGIGIAQMAFAGFGYDQRKDSTEQHIGNFVVFNDKGLLKTGFVDLRALSQFEHLYDSLESAKEDVDFFKEDFINSLTCSLPKEVKYKQYPSELQHALFRNFHRGFYDGLDAVYKEKDACIFLKNRRYPKGLVLPSSIPVPLEEFNELWMEIEKINKYNALNYVPVSHVVSKKKDKF